MFFMSCSIFYSVFYSMFYPIFYPKFYSILYFILYSIFDSIFDSLFKFRFYIIFPTIFYFIAHSIVYSIFYSMSYSIFYSAILPRRRRGGEALWWVPPGQLLRDVVQRRVSPERWPRIYVRRRSGGGSLDGHAARSGGGAHPNDDRANKVRRRHFRTITV